MSNNGTVKPVETSMIGQGNIEFYGEGERLTLLNNWEATYFDFDENKIADLFKGQRYWSRYVLLDDGWFGNKYPRKR
jgi:alpha-galactosidase